MNEKIKKVIDQAEKDGFELKSYDEYEKKVDEEHHNFFSLVLMEK